MLPAAHNITSLSSLLHSSDLAPFISTSVAMHNIVIHHNAPTHHRSIEYDSNPKPSNAGIYQQPGHNALMLDYRSRVIHEVLANKTATINCTGRKAITDLLITKIFFCFAYLIIFLTSICGNSLVIYVVLTSKGMQTVTNIFITNLAVSDLLVCCTSLWLTPIYTYIGHWIWGRWLCYGLPLFQGTSIFISTLTLMSIAVDRYFVICHHSESIVNINERMSMQACMAIITFIWMISLLLVMPYAVHMRMAYVQQPCNFSLCVENWTMADLKSLYGFIVLSLQFIVPFAIIGHSYIRIWRFLNQRRQKNRRSLIVSERENENETMRKKRLLRMLITMVVVFVICWFPFNLLNVLRDMKKDSFLKPYFSFLFLLAHLISMTTTACNPILYAWMNHAFRDEFVRVVPLLGTICSIWQQRKDQYYRGGGSGEENVEHLHASNSIIPNSHFKARIITDCEPAANRRNCTDAVAIKRPSIPQQKIAYLLSNINSKFGTNARRSTICGNESAIILENKGSARIKAYDKLRRNHRTESVHSKIQFIHFKSHNGYGLRKKRSNEQRAVIVDDKNIENVMPIATDK